MKKLVSIFVFSFAAISLISCGASNSSCVSTEKFQVKNIKFENEVVVVAKDFVNEFTTTKHTITNSKFETEVVVVSNDIIEESQPEKFEMKNATFQNGVVVVGTETAGIENE